MAGLFRQAAALHKIIGLVGLPRSGTTLLSSILAVHPRIEAVYEPWNRGVNDVLQQARPDIRLDEFITQFAGSIGGKDVLLVKETATHLTYLDNVARLLRAAAPAIDTDLIVVWRDPFHVFLSEIEARQKWWGNPDVVISAREFDRWADPRAGGLGRMIGFGREFNGLVVFYEALVGDKDRVVPALMNELGLGFDPRQEQYEKYLDTKKVRGDISIVTQPSPISDLSTRQRGRQLLEVRETIKDAAWYERVAAAADAMSAIGGSGVARFGARALTDAAAQVMKMLWAD